MGPINGVRVYRAIALNYTVKLPEERPRENDTYFPTCVFENISAALPPTTFRNADPQNPVMNRKMRYTA